MNIHIHDNKLRAAAEQGIDSFLQLIVDNISQYAGGELCAESMQRLNPQQITLWGYFLLREELMDGGFVQLIHNGYGPFFFLNPFAKAMRLWGLRDFSKLIYKGRELYEKYETELTQECSDEEFMALFESHPEFDELDDTFVENEEQYTALIAEYVDKHLHEFCEIIA